MKIPFLAFRTLTAEVPGEPLAAQAGITPRAAEPPASAPWIPAPEHPEIWAALALIGNSNGVIDRATAGPHALAMTEGDPR